MSAELTRFYEVFAEGMPSYRGMGVHEGMRQGIWCAFDCVRGGRVYGPGGPDGDPAASCCPPSLQRSRPGTQQQKRSSLGTRAGLLLAQIEASVAGPRGGACRGSGIASGGTKQLATACVTTQAHVPDRRFRH